MKNTLSLFGLILILFTGTALSAQDFDTWFDEGVMRVDVMFSGTAESTTYALAGLKKEEFYSASKTQLLDPFDYGNHVLIVRDADSKQKIFSQGFCTLYREWQTTSEANEITRAFPHVLRFPWPKNKVVVEIHDRNTEGEFQLNWSTTLDPDSYFFEQGVKEAFEVVDLEINGPAGSKVDILFIAEGYTADEMAKFEEDAKRSAEYIFSEEPFKSLRKDFNVRAVRSVSEDSGTDIPGEGIWKNTVVNSSFYTFGIERYLTTEDYRAVCDVAANAHYDQIYILVNTEKYGGGGIYNHWSMSASDNQYSRAVVIHEFGHAFAGLGDEYFNSSVAYNEFYPLHIEPWEVNLTTLVNFDAKWKNMLAEDTPVPTPEEERNDSKVGVYEGGGYVAKGVYRPMIDCRMHTNDAEFCPVCSKALTALVSRFTE